MLSTPCCKSLTHRLNLLVWAVCVTAAALLTPLMGCGTSLDADDVAQEEATQQGTPTQVVEQGVFQYTERGRIVQVLEAERIERWENDQEEGKSPAMWRVDQGFVLYIGGDQTTHEASLSATRGTYDDVHGHLEAWDDVVLINRQGDRLSSEHLVWLHDSDVVRTHRPVEITTAQGVLRGRGLRADSRFERYEILAPTGSFDLGMKEVLTDSIAESKKKP